MFKQKLLAKYGLNAQTTLASSSEGKLAPSVYTEEIDLSMLDSKEKKKLKKKQRKRDKKIKMQQERQNSGDLINEMEEGEECEWAEAEVAADEINPEMVPLDHLGEFNENEENEDPKKK